MHRLGEGEAGQDAGASSLRDRTSEVVFALRPAGNPNLPPKAHRDSGR